MDPGRTLAPRASATKVPLRGSRLTLLALAAGAAIALAGCSNVAQPAPPVASSVAEAVPMFASDEEALAAAEAAYRNYMAVTDQIAQGGGLGIERIESLVTPSVFAMDSEGANLYRDTNLHASGTTDVENFHGQSVTNGSSVTVVSAYVCLRLDEIRILDMSGNDVTQVTRADSVPLQVEFLATSPEFDFLLSASEVWTGSNFC